MLHRGGSRGAVQRRTQPAPPLGDWIRNPVAKQSKANPPVLNQTAEPQP